MRKSTLELVAGNEEQYILDSVTEQTENRLISSGEKTLNSTARIYSRGGLRDAIATLLLNQSPHFLNLTRTTCCVNI